MTVALVIVSHSARLAEGVAELAGQMVQGKTPIASAGGAGDNILGTSVDTILAAIQSVSGPDGVLVLLDLGSALLSTEMALEFLDDEQRSRVTLTFAPLVEGAVAAALEASLGRPLVEVKRAAEKTAHREQLLQLKPLEQEADEATTTPTPATTIQPQTAQADAEAQLVVTNPSGLHARPASLIVQEAGRFSAHIEVAGRGHHADAKSIFGVLSLGIRQGDTISLRAIGPDAAAAIASLSALVQANFHESEPTGQPAHVALRHTQIDAEASEIATQLPPQAGASVLQTESLQGETIQRIWGGIPASAGVALGPAFVYTADIVTLDTVKRQTIADARIQMEQQRLHNALAEAAEELRVLAARLERDIDASEAAIFSAQALMLQDPVLRETSLRNIAEQHIDAASALAEVGEQQAALLVFLDNPLLAARAVDVRDAVGRALRHLSPAGAQSAVLQALDHPAIIVAANLTPSDTATLRPEMALAICTVQGGPTAHAAILARALGIPAIAGINEAALQAIHSGDGLALDATNGLLYHLPAPEVSAQLAQRVAQQQQQRVALKVAAQQTQPPITLGGRDIHFLANVGSEAEAEAARSWGAEGIGLLRTEFLFATSTLFPSEEEERKRYARIFRAFGNDPTTPVGKPVVVRTLDAGADKPLPALESVLGKMHEANPALGLRGIRISLAHRVLLEQQLRALLLAAGETGTNLHIMFPMIATVEELRVARAVFVAVYTQLAAEHAIIPTHVPIGIMVEVPASVALAPELAAQADFFSIGANDLLQYTLAIDRTNAAVAALYNPAQPALLRSIAQVASAGRQVGIPVAVCGEMASDPRMAAVLVGLGVDELSMAPTALPAVRVALASSTEQGLSNLARRVLQAQTVAEVEQALRELVETPVTE